MDAIPCPQFGLTKPAVVGDEDFVAEVEREAIALLESYNSKEHKSFVECSPMLSE